MAPFSCERCGYSTDRKNNYERHINRAIPCTPNKLHGNTKITIDAPCDINKNNGTIFNNNGGGSGNTNNITNNTTKDNTVNNITNNIHNHNIIVYNYTHCYINDMSIFEQYLAFTSNISPHIGILDNLNLNPNKPKYHNMKITNKHDNFMFVHDGNEWLNEYKNEALSYIIDSEKIILRKLFYKFRIFLRDDYAQKAIKYHDQLTKLFKEVKNLCIFIYIIKKTRRTIT